MATLTAPIRWLGHTMRAVRPKPGRRGNLRPPGGWFDNPDGGPGGVREPRRPKRTPPAGAMALPEPAAETGEPESAARY